MKYPEGKLKEFLDGAQVVAVTGHYGSGKTEFAVNLAIKASECNQRLTIADVDIVNPYFLSREKEALFKERGIQLISSGGVAISAGLPALSPEMYSIFDDTEKCSIIDLGGDPNGARVLSRFSENIRKVNHRLILILNANRPETATAETAVKYLRAIEESCGVEVSGIVNNTHLCQETDVDCVLKGAKLAEEVSALTGIPVVCHTAPAKFAADPALAGLEIMPIDIYMKKPWEI